ncbi:YceG-like family protein [Arthrobacter woluwensis]|uniref:Endolytic murein transglycosylase n=2 Tax=Arthrobacter woluwensis TaxID=156980 RepID=A0A1H4QBM3_9MICC|nr:YceG-like family protein [Arthrobacter woluwensis]
MSTDNKEPGDMPSRADGPMAAEGMPLTRRELRARERLLAQREEQERAARAAAPFDQEQDELPRRRDSSPRQDGTPVDDQAAAERAAAEKAAAEQARAERIVSERVAAAERARTEKAEAERIAAERAAAEKVQAEKARLERAAEEKAQAERAAAEKAAAARIAAAKAQAEKAAEKAAAERAEAERAAAERARAEKVRAEKLQADKLQADKAAAERARAEKLQADKVEADKIQADKAATESALAAKAKAALSRDLPQESARATEPAADAESRAASSSTEGGHGRAEAAPGSRIAPVPATAHAQHFYPEPTHTRLHPLAHGHRPTGTPGGRAEAPADTVEASTAEDVESQHHGQHEAAAAHSFHFIHSSEPGHDEEAPVKTAFQEEVASPRKHRRVRGWVAVLLSFLLVAGGAFAAFQFIGPSLGWGRVTDYPGPGTGSVSVEVAQGSSVTQVANSLKEEGVVADAGTFIKAFGESGVTLSPGKYTFRKEMKSADAVSVFAASGNDKVSYVPLSAGLRLNESLDAIAKGTGLEIADLKKLADAPAQFGVSSKAKNLEGYLFPGEYRFALGSTAKQVLGQLVKATQDELKAQGVTDPDEQYRMLTIASIVQAEAGRADYPTVAGAVMNRLKHNAQTVGFIQSDATVTYGLGRKSYELTPAEKQDKSNPYNTYANPGLPVGPIGSPGKLAIDAAAHPKASDYLFWVTINLDTGETRFAKTLDEHNRNVALYQEWCSANAGRCQ